MSSLLLIDIRIPDNTDYGSSAETRIVAEWQKQRGCVVRVTGKADTVHCDTQTAVDAALRAARRAIKEQTQR